MWAKGNDLDISNVWMEVEIMDINRVTQRKGRVWKEIWLRTASLELHLFKTLGRKRGACECRGLDKGAKGKREPVREMNWWEGARSWVNLSSFAFVFLVIISGPEIWLTREKTTNGQWSLPREDDGREQQWLKHCYHDNFPPHTTPLVTPSGLIFLLYQFREFNFKLWVYQTIFKDCTYYMPQNLFLVLVSQDYLSCLLCFIYLFF